MNDVFDAPLHLLELIEAVAWFGLALMTVRELLRNHVGEDEVKHLLLDAGTGFAGSVGALFIFVFSLGQVDWHAHERRAKFLGLCLVGAGVGLFVFVAGRLVLTIWQAG